MAKYLPMIRRTTIKAFILIVLASMLILSLAVSLSACTDPTGLTGSSTSSSSTGSGGKTGGGAGASSHGSGGTENGWLPRSAGSDGGSHSGGGK